MFEQNPQQLLANALSILAVLLTASGVFVSTLPLESGRPADTEREKIAYQAGRQDVDARLWQDPFVVMQQARGETLKDRCSKALIDPIHHPATLTRLIERRARGRAVTVLPIMVLGGPHFEDSESRRRSRYAVITALLGSGWEPSDEERLGYVWTFESCVDSNWLRWSPEVLPWEWFSRTSTDGKATKEGLLVLWINEEAIAHQPLRGVNEIVKLLTRGGLPCGASGSRKPDRAGPGSTRDKDVSRENALAEVASLKGGQVCPLNQPAQPEAHANQCPTGESAAGVDPKSHSSSMPWCATRVLGPLTSDGLNGLVRDLADPPESLPDHDRLRFYSSGATMAPLTDGEKARLLAELSARSGKRHRVAANVEELDQRLDARVLRLTVTDDRLARALIEELKLRLIAPNPFWRFTNHGRGGAPLCGTSVVLVSESDRSYTRLFSRLFSDSPDFPKDGDHRLDELCRFEPPRLIFKSYLRGLDGVLPEGQDAASPAASTPLTTGKSAPPGKDVPGLQTSRERADGRSQYDYLQRLADELVDQDLQEQRDGRAGVRAIGVLGSDAYDRIVVLKALRERFPKVVFFTADLDARLMGAEVTKWTRNLVVASAYGLTLNPSIQGSAPPFRDTYQTGLYLSTRVALDPQHSPHRLDRAGVEPWFATPRLFEIGRTRAVALSRGAGQRCPQISDAVLGSVVDLRHCGNIDRLDEWLSPPWPQPSTLFAAAVAISSALMLCLLVSKGALSALQVVPGKAWALAVIALGGLALGWLAGEIWHDVSTYAGEPFAWLEGVSLWPTILFQLAVLMIIVALCAWCLRSLPRDLDRLAGQFHLCRIADRPLTRSASHGRLLVRIRRLWWLGSREEGDDPWLTFVERMSWRERITRIATTSLLSFLFSVALLSIEWPNSTHRGAFSAWCNHLSLLLILLALMTILFSVLDAAAMAARLVSRLNALGEKPILEVADAASLLKQLPGAAEVIRLYHLFKLAEGVGTAANRWDHLPVIAILLVIPSRARVFDALALPIVYAFLLGVATLLAVLCTYNLRKKAGALRQRIIAVLDDKIAGYSLEAECAAQVADGSTDARSKLADGDDWPARIKAMHIQTLKERILASHEGPFALFTEDSIVRALLLLLGGSGAITTVQFLFLSGR